MEISFSKKVSVLELCGKQELQKLILSLSCKIFG